MELRAARIDSVVTEYFYDNKTSWISEIIETRYAHNSNKYSVFVYENGIPKNEIHFKNDDFLYELNYIVK